VPKLFNEIKHKANKAAAVYPLGRFASPIGTLSTTLALKKMKQRLIFLAIAIIGILPGILLCILSFVGQFFFRNESDKINVIGGNNLPTFIWFRNSDFSFHPTIPLLFILVSGMTLYLCALIWMTKQGAN